MKRIIDGVCAFQEDDFRRNREPYQILAKGQTPRYLLITCADSRVVPSLITGLGLGEIFVIRNAGNIVPPSTVGPSGKAAAIEFAVVELGVKHIIVCGHSHCGAMTSLVDKAAMENVLVQLNHLRRFSSVASANRGARYRFMAG
jgi:carbonic anhydrase